jgi:hypothetical protein
METELARAENKMLQYFWKLNLLLERVDALHNHNISPLTDKIDELEKQITLLSQREIAMGKKLKKLILATNEATCD